jgi:hypothetical protein
MLDAHDKMRTEHFESKLKAENEREKPRLTYLEDINKAFTDSIRIGIASRDLMNMTTEWNLVKRGLDETSGLDGAKSDPIAFAEALSELRSIKPKELFELCAKVKARKRWRKFDTPLRSDLLNQYEWMRRVYTNAPKHLKRMGRSDAQNSASDAASLRMKMRWGSY